MAARYGSEEMTIGEVARARGVRASTLRYYEAEGLLPAARRRGGKRVYGPADLDRLAVVELAKASGFTIAEVRVLLGGFTHRTSVGKRWRSLAAVKARQLEERIEQAQRMQRLLAVLARCECPTLADCGRAMRRQGAAERTQALGGGRR